MLTARAAASAALTATIRAGEKRVIKGPPLAMS
jgi:hypothetical protein